jgi:hypothetical protein
MPPEGPDGIVSPSSIPDFIAVAGRDGDVAGYVPSRYLIDPTLEGNIPVYGPDLATLVGYMVPDQGFVPLSAEPSDLRTPDTTAEAASPGIDESDRQLTVFVRNQDDAQRWVATVRGNEIGEIQSYSSGVWVGCLRSDLGTRLVWLSGPPDSPNVHASQTVYTQASGPPGDVWLDFEADRTAFGSGVPDWWPDTGDPCP